MNEIGQGFLHVCRLDVVKTKNVSFIEDKIFDISPIEDIRLIVYSALSRQSCALSTIERGEIMKNIPFVKEDEILIVLCEEEKSDAYEGPLDQIEEVLEIIEEYETVHRLLRLDLTTLHAEDVSEQLADFYIANHEIDEQDTQVQPFILNSDAYHACLEDKVARDYEDNLYGSYEKQHRLRPCDVLSDYWW